MLRAHLPEGVRFRRIAVIDAVVFASWMSQPMHTTWHVVQHPDAYRSMPDHLFAAFFSAYFGETNTIIGDEAFETYLAPWQGEEGREAFVRQALQLEERHTGEIEPHLGSIEVPVLVAWGERDGWLDPSQAPKLQEKIPGAGLELVSEAGHFVQEDAPRGVAEALSEFFGDGRRA